MQEALDDGERLFFCGSRAAPHLLPAPPLPGPHRGRAPPPPFLPYKVDASRPSLRTNWTSLVPFPRAREPGRAFPVAATLRAAAPARPETRVRPQRQKSNARCAPPPPFPVLTGQVSSLHSY